MGHWPPKFPFRFHFGPRLLCCYDVFVAVVVSLVACYSLSSFLLVVVLSLFDDGCGNAQQALLHTVKFVQYVPACKGACSGSSANRWNEPHCAIHKWWAILHTLDANQLSSHSRWASHVVAVVYMLLQYAAFSWHLTTLHCLWYPTLASLSSVSLCYPPHSSLTIYYWNDCSSKVFMHRYGYDV